MWWCMTKRNSFPEITGTAQCACELTVIGTEIRRLVQVKVRK